MPDANFADAAWQANETARPRFRLVPFNEIKLAAGSSYLVKDLIPREGLIVIWGPPKCGKSFWTFDLALHVAMGWEYRGRRVTPGTVVYISLEGERGLAARTEAFRNAKILDTTKAPAFYLLTTRLGLARDFAALIADIRAQLGDSGCAAIVIDTLNRSIEGSESDDRDMGNYVKAADAIREAFKCAVLIIHHCGVNKERPRGHTSLTGAADTQIAIKRDAGDQIIATVEWMKDGPEGAEIVSVLKPVVVGTDDEGEDITSCIVEPAEMRAAKQDRPLKLGPAAKIALDALRKAVDEDGEMPPASNQVPVGVHAVSEELWRRYCYAASISDGGSEGARRKAFSRSAANLRAAGLIGIWDGWVWLR